MRRSSTLAILLLPALTNSQIFYPDPQPASIFSSARLPIATATPGNLARRQTPLEPAPALPVAVPPPEPPSVIDPAVPQPPAVAVPALPIDPAVPPAAPPAIIPNPNDAPAPAPTPTTPTDSYSTTVLWLETLIPGNGPGGKSKTWYPTTLVITFPAVLAQGALPGSGEIGMGTLTGEVGKMKTRVVGVDGKEILEEGGVARARATMMPRFAWGIGAAVGLGVGVL